MSIFYRQKWDIVALFLTNDQWEHCRVSMGRNIHREAMAKMWPWTRQCLWYAQYQLIMTSRLLICILMKTPKQKIKPLNRLLSTWREMWGILKLDVLYMKTRRMQYRGCFFCLPIVTQIAWLCWANVGIKLWWYGWPIVGVGSTTLAQHCPYVNILSLAVGWISSWNQ